MGLIRKDTQNLSALVSSSNSCVNLTAAGASWFAASRQKCHTGQPAHISYHVAPLLQWKWLECMGTQHPLPPLPHGSSASGTTHALPSRAKPQKFLESSAAQNVWASEIWSLKVSGKVWNSIEKSMEMDEKVWKNVHCLATNYFTHKLEIAAVWGCNNCGQTACCTAERARHSKVQWSHVPSDRIILGILFQSHVRECEKRCSST